VPIQVRSIVYTGAVRSYGYKRLALLEAKFGIHELLNADKELAEQKAIPSRDLSNVRKVDTHVHHSGCMTKKHLLDFIRRKLADAPDDVVLYREGRPVTLKEVFEGVSLTSEGLSLDRLDMHAHDTYQRFDRFNNKFNPAGELENVGCSRG
jgi:AMP deaminase